MAPSFPCANNISSQFSPGQRALAGVQVSTRNVPFYEQRDGEKVRVRETEKEENIRDRRSIISLSFASHQFSIVVGVIGFLLSSS